MQLNSCGFNILAALINQHNIIMENQPPFYDPNNPNNQQQQPNYQQQQPNYGQQNYQNVPPYGGQMPPQSPFGGQMDLPNATAILVLGICSIVGCFCYGIPGIICGIIALIMGGKAMREYEANPNMYTISSFNNAKAGRICGIIGTILSVLTFVFWIVYIVFFASFYGSLMGLG
jgi:hypothetical protein